MECFAPTEDILRKAHPDQRKDSGKFQHVWKAQLNPSDFSL